MSDTPRLFAEPTVILCPPCWSRDPNRPCWGQFYGFQCENRPPNPPSRIGFTLRLGRAQ